MRYIVEGDPLLQNRKGTAANVVWDALLCARPLLTVYVGGGGGVWSEFGQDMGIIKFCTQ
jgi:hypothetical protein